MTLRRRGRHLCCALLFAHWIMLARPTDPPPPPPPDGVAAGACSSWNVSVVLVQWRPPAVRVQWHFTPGNYSVARFELTYRPLHARYRVIHDVPASVRSVTLERLQPATEYQLHLVAFAAGGPANISGKVLFVSPDVDVTPQNESGVAEGAGSAAEAPFHVREEEVVIVVLVLAVWVFVIVLFFNKWGKIRMLEPYQPQYHSHPVIAKPARVQLNDALAPLERFNLEFGAAATPFHLHRMRARQNSVFVGSPYRSRSGSVLSEPRAPRKVKSAEDLKSMVIQVGERSLQQSTAL